MVSVHLGRMFVLVFLKDQSLDLCCSFDLSDGLKSECKLFAFDNSLFSVVHGINTLASELNEDLEKINNFNSDPNKQVKEIIFSRKKAASLHPVAHFDNRPVKSTQFCLIQI